MNVKGKESGRLQQGSFGGELRLTELPGDLFRAIASCQSWMRALEGTGQPGTAKMSVEIVVPVVIQFQGGPIEWLNTSLRLVVTSDGVDAPDQGWMHEGMVTFLERLADNGQLGTVVSISASRPHGGREAGHDRDVSRVVGAG